MHSTGISRYPKQQKCFVQGKWLQWNMFLRLAQTCVIHNSQFGKKGCFSYLNFEIYCFAKAKQVKNVTTYIQQQSHLTHSIKMLKYTFLHKQNMSKCTYLSTVTKSSIDETFDTFNKKFFCVFLPLSWKFGNSIH